MTEDEHIAMVVEGNRFHRDFGRLVARSLRALPENIRDEALYHLGDMTSVFGSCYQDYMTEGDE